MANPLGIFFSRLAPEDKRFIRRIGVLLFAVLLLSGGALVGYTYFFGKKPEPAEDIFSFDVPEAAPDTNLFDIPPPPPIIPNILEEATPTDTNSAADTAGTPPAPQVPSMAEEIAKLNIQTEESSDVSVSGITQMLLDNYKLAAKWGHLLLESGYPSEAVYILQKGVPLDSATVPVLVDLAYAHFRSKNTEGGLNILEKALEKFKDNVDLLTAKAAIIGEHPDTTQRKSAEAIFKTALKKDPYSAETNYQYGRYIMQIGDFRKSYSYLENAVKYSPPQNSHYIARLGMAEFYLKQDAKAETLYKKALKLNPYDHNTWFNLGELYLSEANESSHIPDIRQKTRKALEAYLKAIENDSLHARAHYRIGLILNGNGGYKEALKHLALALEGMPNSIPVMQQMSSVFIQLGDTARSVYYLEEIMRIDPFDRIAATEYNRIKGLDISK